MKKINIGILGIALVVLIVIVSGCTSSDSGSNGMSASEIKANATAVDSTDFQHNAENLTDKPIKITGKVFSIQDNMFLMMTKKDYGYYTDNIVYVQVDGTIPSSLANDDIATVYGICNGKTEYDTAIGGSNKVPKITVKPENIQVTGTSS